MHSQYQSAESVKFPSTHFKDRFLLYHHQDDSYIPGIPQVLPKPLLKFIRAIPPVRAEPSEGLKRRRISPP